MVTLPLLRGEGWGEGEPPSPILICESMFGMREDGFEIDKIVLTVNSNYTSTGTGPAESSRQ